MGDITFRTSLHAIPLLSTLVPGATMFGHQNIKIESTTNPDNIRSYTNQIADMEYEAASRAIVKRNGLFAAESIQIISNNENKHWQIILKCATQLDATGLPAAKGPSDDFSVAEKVATYNFIDKAGLGTSATKPATVPLVLEGPL
jgi:hypothetical protein